MGIENYSVVKTIKKYTLGEEIFNAISHGIGFLLGIAGCVIGIVFAALYGSSWSVVSMSIYGAMLIITYSMSTMYHSITNEKAKRVFKILDHCTIFLLIAGTYTPFSLVTLRNAYIHIFGLTLSIGWIIFSVVWLTSIVGIILNSISLERFKIISMICYIATGWVVIFAINPLINNLAYKGVLYLFIGGILYTVGITFYALKKIKYTHSVWHLFVLSGSIFHFFCILLYVAKY